MHRVTVTRYETKLNLHSKENLADNQLSIAQWETDIKLTKQNIWNEVNTFTDVAISTATRFVAKLAVFDTNALVHGVRFTITPVTICGRIAVQPVGGSVRHFRSWLVKPYPAFVVADIAIIQSGVTSQTCTLLQAYKFQSHACSGWNEVGEANSARKIKQTVHDFFGSSFI